MKIKAIQVAVIFCPDCRGQFEVPIEDFCEDEVLECDLCSAEVIVTSEKPPRVKLFTEADDF